MSDRVKSMKEQKKLSEIIVERWKLYRQNLDDIISL